MIRAAHAIGDFLHPHQPNILRPSSYVPFDTHECIWAVTMDDDEGVSPAAQALEGRWRDNGFGFAV